MCKVRRVSRKAGRANHLFILLFVALLLPGCAGHSIPVEQQEQLVVAPAVSEAPVLVALAPSFLLQGTQLFHNRIGRVEASREKGREVVGINADIPVIYTGSRFFSTDKGTYTNLVYRVHFSATPFSLIPFYLGAGRNVGLLVILTLDTQYRPLLVTTVNTCGCYAVSIPTELVSPAFFPDDWPPAQISVYGESLPARIKSVQANETIQVKVRSDVHRVMDIRVIPRDTGLPTPVLPAEVVGLETLKRLPVNDGTVTSLYYEHWPLAGHVKGAMKPWESLSLSLVSLDFFVGMDKDFGDTREGGSRFYTSLKPWNRSASDMNDFAAYLRFNGWKL
jgi:hypothetical protein